MSRVTLIECQPRLPDGTVQTLRLVDRSPRAAAYLGEQWLPHVVELPAFESSIGFDGQRFGAAPSPQIGALAFALAPEIRSAAGWVWRDAPVTIRQADWPIDGSNPSDGAFTVTQICDAAGIAVNDGVARVELIDRGQKLRVPVATMKFGASGNALLDAAAAARDRQAGQVVPVAFGRCFTVPGLLVDRANNIWLFAASAASSVQAFYDGGAPFTLGAARASLAALQGTPPAAGNVVDYCLSAGGLFLARPGDRPVYPFTADATFGGASLGTVAADIVGGRLSFRAGVGDALAALGLGDVGLYIDDEMTVAEALDRLLAGLGIFWKVRSDGTIDARRIGSGALAASFAAHQRGAPSRLRIIMPTARRQLGYAANNRLHGEGDIARILLATDLAYADGTPIEALKPAAAGATVNEDTAGNAIPTAASLSQATFSGGASLQIIDGQRMAGVVGSVGATATFSDFQPARGGEMAYFQITAHTDVATPDLMEPGYNWINAAGAVSAVNLPDMAFTGTEAVGIGAAKTKGQWVTLPADAVGYRLYCRRSSWSASGTFLVRRPFMGRQQPGADITGQNVAANTANVGGVSAAVVEGRGQLLDASTGRAVTRRMLPQIINSGVIQVVGNAILTATTDGSGVATIAIAAHPILDDAGTVSFTASSIGGLAASQDYYVYEINPNYIGGARSYSATTDRNVLATPGARFVGFIRTPAAGGSSAGSGAGAGFQTPGNPEWEP